MNMQNKTYETNYVLKLAKCNFDSKDQTNLCKK